jgi:hypothetical protein
MKNKAQSKIKKVMKEYKAGKLSIGKSSKKSKKTESKQLLLLYQKQERVKRKNEIMKKRGLYANINARKKKGISRPKSISTISAKAYAI